MKQAVELEESTGAAGVRFPLWLQAGFWVCFAIAVAVVVRRAVELLSSGDSGAPAQMAALDAWFRSRAALTWTHILCALAFVVLLPFVWRKRARMLERAFFLLGCVTGLTAYAMSANAVGGWVERSAVLFYDTAFLASLAMAYRWMRRRELALQRRWMIRAVAILLGIATTRPVMGVFFATARVSHLTPQQFFGIAFWIGFSINAIVIELWLRTRAAERMDA